MAKLPILMYHKISASESEGLTISASKLEEQFQYLSKAGFRSYHLSELMDLKRLPSKKSVVITFDDGYVSQLEFAVPLLEKYHLKATFFIPLKYLGQTDAWNTPSYPLMTADQLKSLNPTRIELKEQQFTYGLRIGNRVNHFPFKNPFEINRIDVKGEYSLKKFQRKLKFGKLF